MAVRDETDLRRTDPLNGFLRRWRRNTSRAGVVTAVVASCVAALAVFALCACKAIGIR